MPSGTYLDARVLNTHADTDANTNFHGPNAHPNTNTHADPVSHTLHDQLRDTDTDSDGCRRNSDACRHSFPCISDADCDSLFYELSVPHANTDTNANALSHTHTLHRELPVPHPHTHADTAAEPHAYPHGAPHYRYSLQRRRRLFGW